MESKINIRRITHLLKYELVLSKQPLLIGILGVVAFILAISAMASSVEPKGLVRVSTMESIYPLLFGLGGAVVTSFSFHRISTKGGALNYLSLPASREEKFLVIFLSTVLIYPLGVTLVFVIGQFIAKLGWTVTGGEFQMYNPFLITDTNLIKNVTLGYFTMHSFYFLGSILFKKYSFLKSTVAFFVLAFVFWLVVAIGLVALVGAAADQNMFTFEFNDQMIQERLGYVVQVVVVSFILGLWGLSFLKFKKKEV
ncbi:hypothetical protein [Flammeovirga sp. EKP202]|uniref:hypothetical protein n=1 Tax=Flammeovirga sp. EKP202 TaxID=2770592 RepID=UPI00165F1B95|nr:hypothetical protein [Flammeovirga sp. EKP202]MBD0403068.1 hypothetical protein [Flammeovirga sp. EKP202]